MTHYDLVEVRAKLTGALLRTRRDWVDPEAHEWPDGTPVDGPVAKSDAPRPVDIAAMRVPEAVEAIRAASSLPALEVLLTQELAGRGRQGVLNAIEQRRLGVVVGARDTDAAEPEP